MCKAKPYPRCSHHARQRLEAAIASGDEDRIKKARRDYYTTPSGIKELREAGREALAEKYERRRENLINRARREEQLKKQPLRLALDLDETSGGFINELREFIAKAEGLTPEEAEKRFPVPEHYSLVKAGWFKDMDEFLTKFQAAEQKGVYREMEAFEGVGKTLRTLVANRDVEVHVVTARDIKWNQDTRYWLKKARIPFKTITHTEDKEKVENIDVYIDDSDKQISTLQRHGKTVIAFHNPYNKHVPSRYRVRSWKEVPAVLNIIRQKTAS